MSVERPLSSASSTATTRWCSPTDGRWLCVMVMQCSDKLSQWVVDLRSGMENLADSTFQRGGGLFFSLTVAPCSSSFLFNATSSPPLHFMSCCFCKPNGASVVPRFVALDPSYINYIHLSSPLNFGTPLTTLTPGWHDKDGQVTETRFDSFMGWVDSLSCGSTKAREFGCNNRVHREVGGMHG